MGLSGCVLRGTEGMCLKREPERMAIEKSLFTRAHAMSIDCIKRLISVVVVITFFVVGTCLLNCVTCVCPLSIRT